ncbi:MULTISPECIES: hemin uptake protein HemP [unclassified Thioalkalivibrio]|uniref:hemin uptake protein HemP n=1 Tax=unclassified Thioalkalivibrio TaxID=2621013 RepID=UPI000379E977|nr:MULTISPECIES: hemin uptake protein HemP [unclassified Thioalkalivibrio]
MNTRDGTIGSSSSRLAAGPREVASEDLLGAARQIRIRHRGEWYTLRQTANDKLILTK